MLRGFVEEMGHDYEHLMDGTMEAEDDVDDAGGELSDVAVLLASDSIVEKQTISERRALDCDTVSEGSDEEEDENE